MVVTLFGWEVYQISTGVARHGGLSRYWESREKLDELERAVDIIESHYVDERQVDLDALSERALEAIVAGLDPYSAYLSAKDLARLQEETQQEFGGIGIQVEMRDERLTIVAPIDGTPGARAGLMRGDQILEVDGASIEGRPMDEAIGQLRGAPGTAVQLSLFRPRNGERFDATLKREIIAVQSVRGARMLEGDIGYLRILLFGARTGVEMETAIAALSEQGMRRLVVDLRDNPGGLLEAAVEVASPFLEPDQLIVYTEGRRRSQNDRYKATRRGARYDFPLAVLVNSGSASASEIVAGALKDWGRATLVGEKTFGKASVQSIIQVGANTGLRLTTARYFTPGGYAIHERGIEPDVVIESTVEEDRQLAIQRSRLEYMPAAELEAQVGAPLVEDRQLQAAVELLRAPR